MIIERAEPFIALLGLGCRSASFFIYGMLSTLVWMMLLTSSFLTFYSTNTPTQSSKEHFMRRLRVRLAILSSIFLRRLGKVIATFNAVLIVATGMVQFSSVYDRCYCNSSVIGLGNRAYDVITLVPADLGEMRTSWIGGFVLAAGAATIFAGFVTILIDPPLPPQ